VSRVLFILGMLVLVICEFAILYMDYDIRLTDRYKVINSPHRSGRAALEASEGGIVVENVEGYAILKPGILAGSSEGRYFLGQPKGVIRWFDTESDWRTACYEAAEIEPGALAEPSRLEYPMFLKLQMLLLACAISWLFLFRSCFVRKRRTGTVPMTSDHKQQEQQGGFPEKQQGPGGRDRPDGAHVRE